METPKPPGDGWIKIKAVLQVRAVGPVIERDASFSFISFFLGTMALARIECGHGFDVFKGGVLV